MKVKKIASMLAVAAMATSPLAANAAKWSAVAQLTGTQEVPLNSSPAIGVFSIIYDDTSGVFDWSLSFFNLQSAFTATHIHGPAGTGVNAPVVFDLGPKSSFTLFNGDTFGTKTVFGDFADPSNRTLELVETAFKSGLTYVNVHTTGIPGGEIRAQLLPVPEPSTYALMGTGLALLGFMAHRRRHPPS